MNSPARHVESTPDPAFLATTEGTQSSIYTHTSLRRFNSCQQLVICKAGASHKPICTLGLPYPATNQQCIGTGNPFCCLQSASPMLHAGYGIILWLVNLKYPKNHGSPSAHDWLKSVCHKGLEYEYEDLCHAWKESRVEFIDTPFGNYVTHRRPQTSPK